MANLTGFISQVNELLSSILPILVSLGVLYFIWGVVQYFIFDSEEAKKKGRDRIIYGIIGLAIIISVWGLVYIVAGIWGVNRGQVPGAPENINSLVAVPTDNSCNQLAGKPKIQDYMNYVTCVIGKSVIPLIFALAMVMFIWGAVKFFIIDADEEAKRTQGKQFMIWGIIALAVMISVWGLVKILGDTLSLPNTYLPGVKPD